MARRYSSVLSKQAIDYLCNLDDVKRAKEIITTSNTNSYSFSITPSEEIQQTLRNKLGLTLNNIPMRWVKGDTKPHVDQGHRPFKQTYLLYLTDSDGEFLVNDSAFPITQNTAYVFGEGCKHQTRGTGDKPRLLLGPMSESGLAVGGPSFIYIRQNGSSQEYSYDQTTWNVITWPFSVGLGSQVIFTTNITLTSSNAYFVCTNTVRIGSESLNVDGTCPVITIDGVSNYPGLIQNGTVSSNGYNYTYVMNLSVAATNGSTLVNNGGWVAQQYFAKGAIDCYIVNCNSNGPIIDAGGGIVGGFAGSEGGNLTIEGCWSVGQSATYSGGIVGYYAAQIGGSVTCKGCWSSGLIGPSGGGIFGFSAGSSSGTATAENCYSTGLISSNGGGIFGQYPGASSGQAIALKCDSLGFISTDAGGLFGAGAAVDGGSANATNCYSAGSVTTVGNGVYGSNKQIGATQVNVYVANSSWSDSGANANLVVASIWISIATNQPYELLGIGYTPYTINNITFPAGFPTLVKSVAQTVVAGSSSSPAIISGRSYSIKGGGVGTISINTNTGRVSTTASTPAGTYTLTIRNSGSYYYSTYVLTVTAAPKPPVPPSTQIRSRYSFKVTGSWPSNKRSIVE